MRSRVAHCPGESIDPEIPQPVPRVAVRPVSSPEAAFPAGQYCHPLVDVAVDGAELGRRVALSEVGAPTPKDGIEIFDHHTQIEPDSTWSCQCTDLASDGSHGPW